MGGSYKGLLSLVRHNDCDDPCGLFWILLSAVFHLRTLQITGYFGSEVEYTAKRQCQKPLSISELYIGSTLTQILQLLRYNTHAILEHHVISFDCKNYCLFIAFFVILWSFVPLNSISFISTKKERKLKKSGVDGEIRQLEQLCIRLWPC